MDTELLKFGLTAFVTLFVVIDPIGVTPVFHALTKEMDTKNRRATQAKSALVALFVALFFLLAGRSMLTYLGVTVYAFGISGGILLFATALPMLFGHRPGLQSPEHDEQAERGSNIAILLRLVSGCGYVCRRGLGNTR